MNCRNSCARPAPNAIRVANSFFRNVKRANAKFATFNTPMSSTNTEPDHNRCKTDLKTLRRAKVPYFRIYDLRSTYATRLSAGGVADEWVTQMLRQGDAQVFKKYSQMKLQMKREALEKLNRRASEMLPASDESVGTVTVQ